MICPNCKKELNDSKWCPWCGIKLEPQQDGSVRTPDDKWSDTSVGYSPVQHIGKEVQNGAPVQQNMQNPLRERTNQVPANQFQGNMYNPPQGYDYDEGEGMKSHTKILLAILIPVIVAGLTFAALVFGGVINLSKDDRQEDVEETVVYEEDDTKKLFKTGINHMKVGDYEEAEKVLKKLIEEEPDNEEYVTVYQIVLNYNRSLESLRARNYEKARSYFKKIPDEYVDYDIYEDAEDLDSEIKEIETTYEIFGQVKEFMSNSDYENAEKTIDLIDKSCLTPKDKSTINKYLTEIQQHYKEEEKEPEVELSSAKAEEIVRRFCLAYVDAVNSGDFSIVSPYIKGDFYTSQKGMVSSLYSQGIKEKFDFVSVISVQKINDSKWDVKVSEGETIIYPDGEMSSKTYTWIYTVENINGEYYLTGIR